MSVWMLRHGYDGRPDEAWRSFSCAAHRGKLVGVRELLHRDHTVLEDWRVREHDSLAGRGWRRPEPLAVGAEAHRLVERAAGRWRVAPTR